MGIPRKVEAEEYHSIVRKLSDSVGKEFPDTCLFLYGSYPDRLFTPGVSDIDGGIILDCDAVTPKDTVSRLSHLIKEAKGTSSITLSINLLDRQTNTDGRFMSYEGTYIDWFKTPGTIVVAGKDYLQEMKAIYMKQDELRSAAMNLRTIRNIILRAEENKEKSFDQSDNLRKGLETALDKITGLPKKLSAMVGNALDGDRSKGGDILSKILPDIHTYVLYWAIQNRRNQDNFRQLVYFDSEEVVRENLESIVTAYEEIVKAFIEKYPS